MTNQSEILKDLIKLSGLKTQKAFAEHHGIDKSFLNEVIKGKSEYRTATLNQIALNCGFKIELTYKLVPLDKIINP